MFDFIISEQCGTVAFIALIQRWHPTDQHCGCGCAPTTPTDTIRFNVFHFRAKFLCCSVFNLCWCILAGFVAILLSDFTFFYTRSPVNVVCRTHTDTHTHANRIPKNRQNRQANQQQTLTDEGGATGASTNTSLVISRQCLEWYDILLSF